MVINEDIIKRKLVKLGFVECLEEIISFRHVGEYPVEIFKGDFFDFWDDPCPKGVFFKPAGNLHFGILPAWANQVKKALIMIFFE